MVLVAERSPGIWRIGYDEMTEQEKEARRGAQVNGDKIDGENGAADHTHGLGERAVRA
jgi:hypothetical protein